LFSFGIWVDAAVQVFFQFNIAISGIINLSSMKPKRERFLSGVYIIPASLVVCGMLCALNVFMYLGHFTS
jgi:SNF family Na+-dependent transporter